MYRVMIVEDENIIRTGIRNIIERFGNDLSVSNECSNAVEAWKMFQSEKLDIVITDIVMRGMSGLELTEKIRESGSDIPIIILSGYSEFSYAQKAVHYNVYEYVLKPINFKQFVETLTRLKVLLDEKAGIDTALAEQEKMNRNRTIQHVVEYIKNNLGSDLSLPIVADKVNISASYLSSLFKSETNQKYSDFVTYLRIQRAKLLLHSTDFKIYEIAEICGYGSTKHFISVFKKSTSMTPTQYKNYDQ